jgi:5-hydroxyisourate hydrolase-like protein (transthyretin family)
MGNAVSKLAAFAQNSMTNVQKAMQADMTANNGQVDPAKLQQYSMQMSTYEMIMQMAQKIQEKQEAATQVWLRP